MRARFDPICIQQGAEREKKVIAIVLGHVRVFVTFGGGDIRFSWFRYKWYELWQASDQRPPERSDLLT